jgi:hypothetical protein
MLPELRGWRSPASASNTIFLKPRISTNPINFSPKAGFTMTSLLVISPSLSAPTHLIGAQGDAAGARRPLWWTLTWQPQCPSSSAPSHRRPVAGAAMGESNQYARVVKAFAKLEPIRPPRGFIADISKTGRRP